jgi:hypothetical protein
MHNTKLNALQQVNARLEIAKESVQELQDKLTRYKNNRGEVLMNYEEMISLLEDIYIVCDLNDDMPVTQNWHKKFSDGGFLGFKDSRYNYNRSWTLDHNRHNKSQDYEIPMNRRKRKKYDDGGMLPRKESHSDQMIDIMNKDRESGMLKKYKVKGRIIIDESVHGQDEILHDSSTEKFTINVMASSEKEAAIIAEEQMMDKHLLSDYGTWFTGKKQYYSGSVEIDKVVEISADGGTMANSSIRNK